VNENTEVIAGVNTIIAASAADEFSVQGSNRIVSEVCVVSAFPYITFVKDEIGSTGAVIEFAGVCDSQTG
jgi:hypothetical protein